MMLKTLKKSTVALLDLYFLLVYYNYKIAYLVDCCSLQSQDAITYLTLFAKKYAVSSDTMIIVELGDDIFIINKSSWENRIKHLQTILENPERIMEEIVIVDISEQQCTINNLQQNYDILHALLLCLTQSDITDGVYTLHQVPGALSAPLIAGWLLGYPCIYQSNGSTTEHSNDSSLSMVELYKVSILANITIHQPQSPQKSTSSKDTTAVTVNKFTALEVVGFTVPHSIYTVHTDIAAFIDQKVEEIVNHMNSVQEHTGNTKKKMNCIAINIENVHAVHSTHTVPAIVL